MTKTRQLQAWEGAFGEEYITRNEASDWKRDVGVRAFSRILGDRYDIRSVLEVGSNIGLNLWFLNELWGAGNTELYGVEPNLKAFEVLTSQTRFPLAGAWNCDAFNLPLEDNFVDLAFTSGVLIHIAPKDLNRAISEIVRVSRQYVLCIEYFSRTPEEVPYRGHAGLLFKRDFGGLYLDQFPDLRIVDYGFLWERDLKNFDDLNWWLFEKPATGGEQRDTG